MLHNFDLTTFGLMFRSPCRRAEAFNICSHLPFHKSIIMGPKRGSGDTKASSGTSRPSKKVKKDAETSKNSQGEGEVVEVKCGPSFTLTAPPPSRNSLGQLVFEGAPEFRPNLTPQQVLQMGSFGGTYFRPIKSGVTGKRKRSYGRLGSGGTRVRSVWNGRPVW